MSTTKIRTRSEIPIEHTWDLATIFATPADWEARLAEVHARLPMIRSFEDRLGDSADALADWFEVYQALLRDTQRLAMYATLDYSTDTANQAASARTGQANKLGAEVQAAVAFAEPELMNTGLDVLRAWQATHARLAPFAHYFDNLERQSAHVRSAEVEEVLGHVEDPFRTANGTHGILANSELVFHPASAEEDGHAYEVTHGNMAALLSHPDRHVRRTAWESYADAHLACRNTMANCLVAGVKQNVFKARVRRYGSSLEAALGTQQYPARGLSQPDRCLPPPSADVAPLLAAAPQGAGRRYPARI